ncbi:MAG TPA: NosD domain-containing protein, partial [Candidatus Methylomirabilis sp.]|nr:NosD domain-containing protein [Candidatus Methylomirabilis sp.]
ELQSSDYNIIINNNLSDSYWIYGYYGNGILLTFNSTNNNIINNNISSNGNFGILILDNGSENNLIYHNNLNNVNNAKDAGINNKWDNGYPSGGNYWSDYTGTDSNNDGIGDTPYLVSGVSNVDKYPLMKAYTGEPLSDIISDDSDVVFDNFDTYSNNIDIADQGNWIGDAGYWKVVNTQSVSTPNSLYLVNGFAKVITYIVPNPSSNKMNLSFYYRQATAFDFSSNNPMMNAQFANDGAYDNRIEMNTCMNSSTSTYTFKIGSGPYAVTTCSGATQIGPTMNINQWYYIELQFDFVAHTMKGRVDGSPWSSIVSIHPTISKITAMSIRELWNGNSGIFFDSFGTNTSLPTENQVPDKPIELSQLKSDGTTQIIVGGATDERTVVFSGKVSDPDSDKVKLQMELRRTDEYGGNFDENQGGLKNSSFVTNGSEISITVNDLIDGNYHWRARTIDEHDKASDWIEFENNPTSNTDFIVSTVSPSPTPTPNGELLSAEIVSPSEGALIIEDEDILFSSKVSGGAPPYDYKWYISKNGDGNSELLSTSDTFNFNYYTFKNKPAINYEYIIGLGVADSNGGYVLRQVNVHISPPAPEITYNIWQFKDILSSPEITGMPDKNKKYYEIQAHIKNTDDNPHFYKLNFEMPVANDAPDAPSDWLWPINAKTDEAKSDSWGNSLNGNNLQQGIVNPGQTITFAYQFKSDWNWLAPYSLTDKIYQKIWEEDAEFLAGKTASILFDSKTIWDFWTANEVAKPIVKFSFAPSSLSTSTMQSGVEVPVYVGEIKNDAYKRYFSWKIFGVGVSMANVGPGNVLSWEDWLYLKGMGWAGWVNAEIALKQAVDPNPDYTQIVEPVPYDIHELNDSLPNGLRKMALLETFNTLSYKRAEVDSYVKYTAAVNDGAYQYAVLQLGAAREYNSKYIERVNVLNGIYRLLLKDSRPLTDDEINDLKN